LFHDRVLFGGELVSADERQGRVGGRFGPRVRDEVDPEVEPLISREAGFETGFEVLDPIESAARNLSQGLLERFDGVGGDGGDEQREPEFCVPSASLRPKKSTRLDS
jgi:hypothetical protein